VLDNECKFTGTRQLCKSQTYENLTVKYDDSHDVTMVTKQGR